MSKQHSQLKCVTIPFVPKRNSSVSMSVNEAVWTLPAELETRVREFVASHSSQRPSRMSHPYVREVF